MGVLQDNADKSRSQDRIKRSVEPGLLSTRMTSFMDSSSMRDDAMVKPNVYNMMGQDMSNNMIQRNRMNQMSSQRNVYDMVDRSSSMRDTNMMGRKRMGQNMYSNMMGSDMSSNLLNRNMIGQDVLNRNMLGQEMSSNVMGRDMSSNMMNTYANDINRIPLGQRNTMSQMMQIQQIPQSVASRNTFF